MRQNSFFSTAEHPNESPPSSNSAEQNGGQTAGQPPSKWHLSVKIAFCGVTVVRLSTGRLLCLEWKEADVLHFMLSIHRNAAF